MKAKKVQRNSTKKKKKDLCKVTTQEFLQQDFENDTSSDDNDEQCENTGRI